MTTAVSLVSIEKRSAIILLDCTDADLTYTLGSATVAEPYVLTEFFRSDMSGNAMTVTDGGSFTSSLVNQNDSLTVFSNGTSWISKSTAQAIAGVSQLAASAATAPKVGGTTSATKVVKLVSAIADNTFTDAFTVTVPNAVQAAGIFIRAVGFLSDFDSTAAGEYMVAIARKAGVDSKIGGDTTKMLTAMATGTGTQTVAMSFQLSALTGVSSATQTFTVQVKIARGGGATTGHKVVLTAELVNYAAAGVAFG